ncbi:MAG TPA: pyruvate, water dikinase regulatory protein [Candidatus Acidoferrum sp.]|nr:pyruvate, water dikinase regulatory protein [Candidatus Acidoferrum sp.]
MRTPAHRKSEHASPPIQSRPRVAREIVIASDATGRTAEMVVRAALVQFRGADVRLHLRPHVRSETDVRAAVRAAADVGGLIVHTLVLPELRNLMLTEGRARNVPTIDLLGPLLLRIEDLLQLQPLAKPGLFRELDQEYRRRFEVVEYTVKHDDGQNPQDLHQADVVLVGVSRTSKTPLSMFLAGRGLRVANVPVVNQLPLPEELVRLDPRKVVGLTIGGERLLELRRSRLQQMETPPKFPYADPRQIWAELEYAKSLCARAGWPMVDVTDKSIEEVASEVLVFAGIEQPAPPRVGGRGDRPSAWRRTSE